MARLTIALLGPPRIERDATPIEVDTRKAVALLAYLAVGETGGVKRDSLAALFWPDVDEAHAHAALRRTLSALNKALASDSLQIDRENVALRRSPLVWIDADQFQAHVAACRTHGHAASAVCNRCLPQLSQAAALYRDDFMAGFTLRDSPGFDDWQFFQSENFRRTLAGALERLVNGLSAGGDYEAALAHARRWLALDSLHEPAHRHLMQLYAWAGQRAAALRQYRDCLRVLERELGVAPLEETTHLYEAIKENRLAPAPGASDASIVAVSTATPPPASPHASVAHGGPSYPLVGRAAEWSALLSGYQSISGDGRLVVLQGEAGIGKTRLAEAALQNMRGRGAVGLVALCYEGELKLAYGPFVEALRAGLGQAGATSRVTALAAHWLSEAGRLLPELPSLLPDLPPPATRDNPGAQGRFFEGIRQILLAILLRPARNGAPPAPGVLLIDDAQWMDEASLDLLTYLVRRLRDEPVCILMTWRSEQVPPGHRLRQVLAEAQRAGLATAITLDRLSLPAVSELVGAVLAQDGGRAPDQALVQRLYEETEGLPFFLVEYLASLSRAPDGERGTTWSLPGGVRNLLLARLAATGETGGQLLHAAAVIGRSFDLDTLQSASGRSDDETVSGLEALIAAGVVHELPGSGRPQAAGPVYDFSHEKLRSLVYEQTSLARRRLLHRRVAEALAVRSHHQPGPASAAVASQVAQHYQLAGREAEAAEFYRLAGEHARALYANADALAHFRSALALGHPAAAAMHEAIGDLLTLLGSYNAALASLETAAALAEPQALPALEHKLGGIYHRRGDWELAESHLQAALAAYAALEPAGAEAHAGQRARVYADWSLTAHQRGDREQAAQLAQQALALAESAGDRRALAQAHNILGVLAGGQQDFEAALENLERSLSLATELGDASARVAALNNLALAYSGQGQVEKARQLTGQALALCITLGDRHREAALHSNLADLLHATGQAELAMTHLKQSVTINAEIGAQAGGLQPEIWKLSEW